MDKIWLKEYPPGMPAEIDPDQYSSLKALAEDCMSRNATRNAYVQMGTSITYGELDEPLGALWGLAAATGA